MSSQAELPQVQRVAAYAVIVRDGQILLSRLAPRVSRTELWTLPGGGIDHGESTRDAVIREIYEETGLRAEVAETARVYSGHMPDTWRQGRRVDAHAVRVVYEGWVAKDSPEPRVLEVDGSTMEAAWRGIDEVLSGDLPVSDVVRQALQDSGFPVGAAGTPVRRQRPAAYAVIRRHEQLLLTRLAPAAPHAGHWTLPGGGIEHGESPADAVVREVAEECGLACRLGPLIGVHDTHFTGIAPNGRTEDFHGIHLVFEGIVDDGAQPRLLQPDATTDDVGWVSISEIERGVVPVTDLVSWVLLTRPAGRNGASPAVPGD